VVPRRRSRPRHHQRRHPPSPPRLAQRRL